MKDMRNKLHIFLGMILATALCTGCVQTLNLHDTTADPN